MLYVFSINTAAIEARGDDPLRDIIHSLGGWPILDDYWDEKDFDIIDLIARLRLFNNRVLINSWVSADDKNSEVNIIQVSRSGSGRLGAFRTPPPSLRFLDRIVICAFALYTRLSSIPIIALIPILC